MDDQYEMEWHRLSKNSLIGSRPISIDVPDPIFHFKFSNNQCLTFIKLFKIYETLLGTRVVDFIQSCTYCFFKYFSMIILCHVPSPNKAHHKHFTANAHPKFSVFFIPWPLSSFLINISSNQTKCILLTSFSPDYIKFEIR